MIRAYESGTEVKWNEANALQTGVVEDIFRHPMNYSINGSIMQIDASENSPYYLILRPSGEHIVLSHDEIMLKQVNHHT